MEDWPGPTLWDRTRWPRYAFVAGVLVGIILGWFFHQVVSLVMGAGFVLVLLLPLLVIGYLWWRSRSHRTAAQGPTVVTWRYDTAIGAPRIDRTSGPGRPAADDWLSELDTDVLNADPRRRRRRSTDAELWLDDDPTDVQDANWTPRS